MAACQGTLMKAQKGLPMRAVFGEVWTIYLKTPRDKGQFDEVLLAIQQLDRAIQDSSESCGLVAAFDPEVWQDWTGHRFEIHREVLDRGIKLKDTGGHVLLYVKGPSHKMVRQILSSVEGRFGQLSDHINKVTVGKRSDCRIIAGRYLDSISNPNDPISLTEDILLGEGDDLQGGSFAFTQQFTFNWPGITSQTPDAQDEVLGRNSDNVILPQHAALGHVHRAHMYDQNRDQRKLLRQALPYGTSNGHHGREEGIMFVAFCNDQDRFEKILENLLGKDQGTPVDRLMHTVEGIGGNYWFVPPAKLLKVTSVSGSEDVYEDPHWQVNNSANGFMFYNSQDYLHQMGIGKYVGGDPPSPRVLSLMSRTFNHWRDGWMQRQRFPRLKHLHDLLGQPEEEVTALPVAVRKGLANRETLASLLSSPNSKIARNNGLLRIEPKELLVGVIPDFTLGRGKEVVPYLSKDETMAAWLNGELNEWSAMGHVVPDYQKLVSNGLGNIINDLQKSLDDSSSNQSKEATFYKSALESLAGVQGYLRNWSEIAAEAAKRDSAYAQNMRDVSGRLKRLMTEPPSSFHDAVQLIFSFHCCLHLVGELTAFGRLDQILEPFLSTDSSAHLGHEQEIVDCLWMKIGENAFVDRSNIYDYVTYGTTSVCGVGGNFPQGGGINQWVQQITVGGYKATADATPQGGANRVTILCLKAARRIPVNAPTLSLRVYKDMPQVYLEEAAKSILAGGAHPILYNDDKLCKGLHHSGESVDLAWSRNYAADGCYEPMLAGASEFAFNNVQPLLALEQTLNQGSTYGAAGPEQLRGLKQTFRSPPSASIKSFEELQCEFLKQLEWLVVGCYNLMINSYGNLNDVCPSPLLSTIIQGCVEKGRDLTYGGSKFHVMAPLCVGMSNTIDSLFAIKKLVYDPDTAMTTLPELVNCLINDWGFNMQEPLQDHQTLGLGDSAERGLRYQELRSHAMSLPKWGSGNDEVNELGEWLMRHTVRLCREAITDPSPALEAGLKKVKENHGADFEFIITPGIGTFEGYVGDGIGCGASADGRRNGMPIASDLSPVPAAQDLPAAPAFRNIYQAMKSVKNDAAEYGISNASPVDMNIQESFPLADLQQFLHDYANGKVGGNLITLTCADLDTYQKATKDPEKYNLVRVRMGGWTEFYATMFEAHQDQHQRRQYFTP